MITQVFRDNRARFPPTELAAHKGNWIAFSKDGTQIVASAPSYEGVETQLVAMGIDGQDVVFESVGGDENVSYLGAAEWM